MSRVEGTTQRRGTFHARGPCRPSRRARAAPADGTSTRQVRLHVRRCPRR
ncbi:hypothetical protein ACFPRL_13700 [Pseudoclavibacter helvolus]